MFKNYNVSWRNAKKFRRVQKQHNAKNTQKCKECKKKWGKVQNQQLSQTVSDTIYVLWTKK